MSKKKLEDWPKTAGFSGEALSRWTVEQIGMEVCPVFLSASKTYDIRNMERFTGPDAIHLQAAQGWLESGNHLEANEELDKISASLRPHPDVLAFRWRIYAQAKKWEACYDTADALINVAP